MEVQTNEGRPDPYAGTQWERATVPILSLKKANAPVFTWDWKGFRGSKTEGPIVLSHDGEIIDGNNRLYEAIKRGEGDIEVYRPAGGGPPAPAGGALADTLQGQADAAIRRMRDRGTFSGTQSNALFPAEDLADMAIWGAAKMAKGVTQLGAWSKEMLADAGSSADRLKPQLRRSSTS